MGRTHTGYTLIADNEDELKLNINPVTKNPGQHHVVILIDNQAVNFGLSEAHMEIFADTFCEYLDKLEQEKLSAAAAATDAAIEEMLSCG